MEYGYHFSWRRGPDDIVEISGRGFRSKEERNSAYARALFAFGYKPPRLWQWWRWGENKPSVNPLSEQET